MSRYFAVRTHHVEDVLRCSERACTSESSARQAAASARVASLDPHPMLFLNDDHSRVFLGLRLKAFSTQAACLARAISEALLPFGCPPAYSDHVPHVSIASSTHPTMIGLAQQWKTGEHAEAQLSPAAGLLSACPDSSRSRSAME